ncbi:odorant receptor 33a-like isoform X2 [Diabrotica undecimpunctata]|uniref:odorant receptor 33a-like isoform X2 n=1 Tax=Diabrotica undecimpunctata TaxID=50387 RepID=UPI003B636C03
MWRPESQNDVIQSLYTLYVIGIFLFVNLFFTFTEFLSILYVYNNEYDLIKNISFALTHFMGAVKVVFFYFQGHKLKRIMNTLEDTKLHYENCPEKDFYPEVTSKLYKKIGKKYTIIFFMMAHATLTSSYLPPFLATLRSEENNPERMLPDRLPYYSWMPFRFDTAGTYLIALGYQAIPMFSYAYSIVGMDTLFMNIMNCVGMNLEIIQGAFLSILPRAEKKTDGQLLTQDGLYNTEELTITLRAEMKKISQHLQVVYKVCEDLEDIHKYLTLAQATATLFILCSCLYLVSMADKMPFYIWQCDWLTADKEFKMSMILSMARAKRPLYLTAGKFAPLTLPTFVAIVKASYSFFAVIKNTSD